jgi:hypothetical protein
MSEFKSWEEMSELEQAQCHVLGHVQGCPRRSPTWY